MTPNWFAYVALLSWPLVALYLYSSRPIGQATMWTILGGYLLLPVGTSIKFDMIPDFDKYSISALAAAVGCVMVTRRMPRIWHGFGLLEALILMFVISPFITSELNPDPIVAGPRILPGETLYDALSAAVAQLLVLIPFFLGRYFLRNDSDIKNTLRILTIAGLSYSLLMLFEVRMSPQLHVWTYGYFPSEFIQQFRDEGFRPVVFIGHGLPAAFFAMATFVAASALWRARIRIAGLPPAAFTAYLGVVLALCKTLGALVYGAVLVPLVRWATPRTQFRVASILVIVALIYPVLRTVELIPTTLVLDAARTVSAERAMSLNTRFDSEQILLNHASERIWFGWGRWGRNRVYGEAGQDLAITDGGWVITLGTFGIIGFIAQFGLLASTVLGTLSVYKLTNDKHERIYLAALALIVAVSIFDLVPNSGPAPWSWLLSGALIGRLEALKALAHQTMVETNLAPRAWSKRQAETRT